MVWRRKSYEVLPALSVRGEHLRRSLRISTIAWMYGVVWMACVNGAHMTEFLRMLGFNNFAFGLMAALPFAATFGQPIAAILIERTGLRKYQFIYCGTIHRLLWLVVAGIPLIMPLPSRSAVATMLIVVGLGWFLNALAMPAWLTWMGDLIPRRIRGRHLATRMRVGRAVQILVVIALGATLDAVTNRSASISAGAQPVLLYTICAVLAAAALFGATDILLFRKIREVIPSQDVPRRPAVEIKFPAPQRRTLLSLAVYTGRCFAAGVHQLLLEPLKDRVFRHYVAYGATITFAMCVAGPFFMRNVLENLGFTKLGANSVYMVVGPIVGAVALKGWGKLIDRWGRRPVLILATICTVFSIMPNFFAAPQTPSPRFVVSAINWGGRHLGGLFGKSDWTPLSQGAPVGAYLLIMLSIIIGGAGWVGVQLAKINVWLGFSDGHGRSRHVAASAVLMSLGGVLGGLVGGLVAHSLRFLQDKPIILGPFLWNNWHATMGVSMLARGLAIIWLINMPDPGSGTVRGMVRYMIGNAYNNVTTRLFYPLRILGWGRAGDTRGKTGNPRRKQKQDSQ